MSKRKRKKDDVRARMLRRVTDVYCGADIDYEEDGECSMVSIEHAPRLVRGIVKAFGISVKDNPQLVAYWNLDNYETPDKLTDFLLGHGVKP